MNDVETAPSRGDPEATGIDSRATAQAAPRRIRFGLFLLLLVSTLVGLVLAELGLRAFFWAKNAMFPRNRNFSETVGWETTPYLDQTYECPGYGRIHYTTCQGGFRVFGDPNSPKKRVLVLGDSYTQAGHVSDGEAFYNVLCDLNPNWEFFAYGCMGYGSLQEYMILDHYFDAIRPDMVLWQFCSNDFINNDHELESLSYANNNLMTRPYLDGDVVVWKFPRLDYSSLVQRSYLLRLLNLRLNRVKMRQQTIEAELHPEHPLMKRSVETTARIMGKVRARCGDIPIVAFSADEPDWCAACFEKATKPHNILFIEGVQRAIEDARRSGLKGDNAPADFHWNATGHRVAAETIHRALNERGILHSGDL